MYSPEPIFCCASAVQVITPNNTKLHNDPNREIHDAIFRSFLGFAFRRQTAVTLMALIRGDDPKPSQPSTPRNICPPLSPEAILTPEALRNSPITPNTPYIIHLISRHDFGPVLSHRYFVCPQNLQHDWIEATLEQWFAAGEQFKFKAQKWDLKCLTDCKFFRLTLRPNLGMRFAKQPDAIHGVGI